MKKYTIYLGETENIEVKGDGFELDNAGVLSITYNGRIVACFNFKNILGFEEGGI